MFYRRIPIDGHQPKAFACGAVAQNQREQAPILTGRINPDGFRAEMLGVQGESAWSVFDKEVADLCWSNELGVGGGRAR
jgi:hypothetical protein